MIMKHGMNMMPKAKRFITRLHQDLNTGMNMMLMEILFVPKTRMVMKIGSNMTPKATELITRTQKAKKNGMNMMPKAT